MMIFEGYDADRSQVFTCSMIPGWRALKAGRIVVVQKSPSEIVWENVKTFSTLSEAEAYIRARPPAARRMAQTGLLVFLKRDSERVS